MRQSMTEFIVLSKRFQCGPFLIGLLFGWATTHWERKQCRITKR